MTINFLGIGVQKCASTWVHSVLHDHPQVFHSEPKELDYFSYFYGKGRYWYEKFFAQAAGHAAVGENSPSYFHHPLAPARAFRYNPDLRIIVALRDPIERAYSNHLHMIKSGFLTGPDLSFEYGMANNEMYLEQSRYATHLKRWLDHFPREQVLVLLQEEIRETPEASARALYRFLGVAEDFESGARNRRANESRVVKNPGLDSALKQAGKLVRGLGLGALVEQAKHSPLVSRLRRANEQDLRTLVPPMQDQSRAALLQQLGPELDALAKLLARERFPWASWDDHLKAGGARG